MNCSLIKDDFICSVFKIIIHKIGNIANVFSVNIEAFLSSSSSEVSKTFVYRMKDASNSLNSFIDFMRVFISKDSTILGDNEFWERFISLVLTKNRNLSISKMLNINELFFRLLSVILSSFSSNISSFEEKDGSLIVSFFSEPDSEICSYLTSKNIKHKKNGNFIYISY